MLKCIEKYDIPQNVATYQYKAQQSIETCFNTQMQSIPIVISSSPPAQGEIGIGSTTNPTRLCHEGLPGDNQIRQAKNCNNTNMTR
jgi:hypothetical protein